MAKDILDGLEEVGNGGSKADTAGQVEKQCLWQGYPWRAMVVGYSLRITPGRLREGDSGEEVYRSLGEPASGNWSNESLEYGE